MMILLHPSIKSQIKEYNIEETLQLEQITGNENEEFFVLQSSRDFTSILIDTHAIRFITLYFMELASFL
jgi:hypothetical protein